MDGRLDPNVGLKIIIFWKAKRRVFDRSRIRNKASQELRVSFKSRHSLDMPSLRKEIKRLYALHVIAAFDQDF